MSEKKKKQIDASKPKEIEILAYYVGWKILFLIRLIRLQNHPGTVLLEDQKERGHLYSCRLIWVSKDQILRLSVQNVFVVTDAFCMIVYKKCAAGMYWLLLTWKPYFSSHFLFNCSSCCLNWVEAEYNRCWNATICMSCQLMQSLRNIEKFNLKVSNVVFSRKAYQASFMWWALSWVLPSRQFFQIFDLFLNFFFSFVIWISSAFWRLLSHFRNIRWRLFLILKYSHLHLKASVQRHWANCWRSCLKKNLWKNTFW